MVFKKKRMFCASLDKGGGNEDAGGFFAQTIGTPFDSPLTRGTSYAYFFLLSENDSSTILISSSVSP